MLSEITCRCEADGCSRELDDEHCMLVFRSDGVERRAYECVCGHVTITVARPQE